MHRALLLFVFAGSFASAQVVPYAGVVGGISTLSAGATARASTSGLSLSAYAPQNGGAVNIFAGLHLHHYFSVQRNYMWNRNAKELSSLSRDSNTEREQ